MQNNKRNCSENFSLSPAQTIKTTLQQNTKTHKQHMDGTNKGDVVFQDKQICVCVWVCVWPAVAAGDTLSRRSVRLPLCGDLCGPPTLVSGGTTLPLVVLCRSTQRRSTKIDHKWIFVFNKTSRLTSQNPLTSSHDSTGTNTPGTDLSSVYTESSVYLRGGRAHQELAYHMARC